MPYAKELEAMGWRMGATLLPGADRTKHAIGTDGGTRTRTSKAQGILSPWRLPFRHVRPEVGSACMDSMHTCIWQIAPGQTSTGGKQALSSRGPRGSGQRQGGPHPARW